MLIVFIAVKINFLYFTWILRSWLTLLREKKLAAVKQNIFAAGKIIAWIIWEASKPSHCNSEMARMLGM